MVSLNNYSIKHRVLILAIIPLVSAIILSSLQVSLQFSTYDKLATISENLSSGDMLLEHASTAKQLASNRLNSQTQDQNEQSSTAIQILNLKTLENKLIEHAANLFVNSTNNTKDQSDKTKNSQDTSDNLQPVNVKENKYKESLSSLAELTESVGEFDSSEITDWYSEIIDNENELMKWLEKYHLHSGIKGIDQNLHVIMQLRWIMFWASQENWYSTLILNNTQPDELSSNTRLINRYAIKQELFIERFLSMSANKEQIKLMLDIFSSDAFMYTAEFRERITEGNTSFTPQEIERFKKAFKDRLAITLSVSETISQKISKDIKQESSKAISIITYIVLSIFIAIGLTFLLGFNVITRLFKYLQGTLTTLSAIEENKDYSLTLSTIGNDELTTFSKTLNSLIDDRRVHDNALVQAKKDADKANQAKSFFLANMSHEIRTPLNGILGMNTILKETSLSSSQKNHLSIIDQSSKTLLYLINDILDISKIESGNFDITPYPTDFRELIYSTTTLVMSKATEKGIDLNIHFNSITPHQVNIDAQRLRQVLMNLLSNAVKFTHRGSVTVVINCVKGEDNTWNIAFEVSDSGIGISKENQKVIFDAFVQADGSITREFGGTGLGLAISAQIVKLMHGEIICTSEEGKGSKFSFDVTCEETNSDKINPTPVELQGLAVYLVSNGTINSNKDHQYSGIIGELTSINNTSFTLVETIDDLPSTIDSKAFIFYFHSSLDETKNDLEKLVAKYRKEQILLFQKTSDDPADYRDLILGQVSLPILGDSLFALLKDAIDKGNVGSKEINNENDKCESSDEDITILIVEDNKINQKVTSLYLKTMGYQFEIAENGQEAVDMILAGKVFNMILMDCMMPVMDGFNATINIREYEKNNGEPRTPIVALTASIFQEDIDRCYASQMDGYLPKPIDKALLQKEIIAYLNKGKHKA